MRLSNLVLGLMILFFSLGGWCDSAVESYLQNQRMIRVYVDSAPGFGHQSAGISVMRRLRELGFQGEYEVIYQASVAAKLQKIYPAFPQGIRSEVRYLTVEEFKALQGTKKSAQVDLAISGADDGFGFKFKEISNADVYLRLQPMGWGQSILYNKKNEILTTLRSLPLVNLESTNSATLLDELRDQGEISQEKKDFVAKFVENSNEHFRFPIYGVGVQVFAAQRMYFYAKAVKSAAKRMNPSKAILIPVISPFNAQEMDTINKVFGKTSGFESASPSERRMQKEIHLMQPREFSNLDKIEPGHVYFIFVGSVPQNVFNLFYESANLPVWVAGKNAMSFATSRGKPYLNTVDDYYLPGLENLSAQALRVIQDARSAFKVGYQRALDPQPGKAISKFIQQSSTPQYEVFNFYRDIGVKLSANDKVLEGLRNIVGRPTIFSCQRVFTF